MPDSDSTRFASVGDADDAESGDPGHSSPPMVWLAILTVLVAFAVIGIAVVFFGRDTQTSTPAPVAASSQAVGADLDDILDPCSVLPEDGDFFEDLQDRGQQVVDARCDPDPSAPVGAYEQPEQRSGTTVARLNTGDRIAGECVDQGEAIANQAGASSEAWIRFTTDAGETAYVPAIWVQGPIPVDAC